MSISFVTGFHFKKEYHKLEFSLHDSNNLNNWAWQIIPNFIHPDTVFGIQWRCDIIWEHIHNFSPVSYILKLNL
jgi:hypothetical protein